MPLLIQHIAENAKRIQQDHPHAVLGVISAAVALVVLRATTRLIKFDSGKDGVPLPSPGISLPLIGHVLSLYPSPHFKLIEWSKKYGPIYQISLGSRNAVVLNNSEVSRDLLEINGQFNSDRNPGTLMKLTGADGSAFSWADDTPYLRKCRRLMQAFVSKSAIEKKYPELHNEETFELLQNIYRYGTQPQGFRIFRHSYLYTTNLAMRFMYGCHYPSTEDPDYRELQEMAADFAELANYLLFEFPKPAYLFLGRLKKWASSTQVRYQKVMGRYNTTLKNAIAKGEAVDCLMGDIIKLQEKEGLTDIDVNNIAATVYIAAVDTTSITAQNLYLVLVNRPDVQRKAQEELDRVVGNRMPRDDDIKNLPYIQAMVEEIMRFRPPLLLNLPHSARTDQVYKGYKIPAGSVYIHNIYSCNHDPSVYPNPDKFDPDRFYNPEQPVQRYHWTFGAGRRLCPGNQFAEKSLYLTTARVLWAFTLVKPRDANGNEIEVPITDVISPISHPPDVDITFVPRQDNLAEMLSL
ncbi:hypothetical protein EC973_005323 [Apophysomyces ossiformis]|uniref:Cytochrome P450 n=1 Tax=Apophysomyces ossiformis TaxID=679940 RepID=A0A8H7EUT3_9FUNG|nr:hypothetical protein EC973_005323 [Apophysomyces ossiformis]